MSTEDKEQEIYKPVMYEDFGNFYEVSNYGNIRKIGTTKNIKPYDNNGYLTVRF